MAKKRKISIEFTVLELDGLAEVCEQATAFCIDAGLDHKKERPKLWRKNFMAIAAAARKMQAERDDDTKARQTHEL